MEGEALAERSTEVPVSASAAVPTITHCTPSAAKPSTSSAKYAGGQRFAPPYAAPGAIATSGTAGSHPVEINSARAVSRASAVTVTRGSLGPFANPSARTRCW